VLRVLEASLPTDHVELVPAVVGMASLAIAEGKHGEARSLLERALGIVENTSGRDHPRVAVILYNLGIVSATDKDFEASLAAFQRALAIDEAVLAPDAPHLANIRDGIGWSLLELGRGDEAVSPLERALAGRTVSSDRPMKVAQTRHLLAQAIWKAGAERKRAITLARQARRGYAEAGEKEGLAEVETWLRDRGAKP